MSLVSRIKLLSPEVAAYIGGLIDGEGTVTLSRLHANESRRLVVSIANNEIEMLTFVLEQTGAGKITRKRSLSERHMESYCYAITARQALALLRQVSPHMRSYKRKRAELALRLYEALTPRNGRYSPSVIEERRKFERDLLSLRPGS